MTNGLIDFTPGWNADMGRKSYILNNLMLVGIAFIMGVLLSEIHENSYDSLSLFFLVGMAVYAIFAIVVSLIWTNNRLRDSGLTSQGWRVFWIVLSVCSGLIGLMIFLYCCTKPTEDPVILIDEGDNDSRDEGPR